MVLYDFGQNDFAAACAAHVAPSGDSVQSVSSVRPRRRSLLPLNSSCDPVACRCRNGRVAAARLYRPYKKNISVPFQCAGRGLGAHIDGVASASTANRPAFIWNLPSVTTRSARCVSLIVGSTIRRFSMCAHVDDLSEFIP